MKKRIIYAFSMLLLIAGFAQCSTDDGGGGVSAEETAFLAKTGYCSFDGSSEIFTYSETTCQYVMGVSTKSVRMQYDDASKYISLTFSADPVKDIEQSVDVVVKGISGLTDGQSTATLKVLEAKDNMLWLWDEVAKRGYLVPWGV